MTSELSTCSAESLLSIQLIK